MYLFIPVLLSYHLWLFMKKNHIIGTIVTSDRYHVQRNNLGTYIFALLLSFIITSKVFFQKEDWIYFVLVLFGKPYLHLVGICVFKDLPKLYFACLSTISCLVGICPSWFVSYFDMRQYNLVSFFPYFVLPFTAYINIEW